MMSVISCSRKGCSEIMCDLYIQNYAICDDCHRELEAYLKRKFGDGKNTPKGDVIIAIDKFMDTERAVSNPEPCNPVEYLEEITKNRHDDW